VNKVINVNKVLVTSTVLAVSFILLVGPISMTINVAQGNTANSTQSQNNTGNDTAAKSGGGNQASLSVTDNGPRLSDIKTGENSGDTP
jgi:hypothetical protein